MPKREIRQLELECEYCNFKEVFDLSADPSTILPKFVKWNGMVNAGAPAGQGIPDQTKWFDSPNCLVTWVRRDEMARDIKAQLAKAAEPDPKLSPAAQASGAISLVR